MAEKLINTRIALKIDTYANWTNENLGDGKGAKFLLKRGEIGLCEIKTKEQGAQTAPTVLFKVGSVYPEGHEKAGQLIPFKELPWASALAADVYGWAKASDVVLDGKKIKFVGTNKEIDLAGFALTSDLTDAVSGLTAADTALSGRIDTIEAKLGIEGEGKDLATQIADAVKVEEDARKAADLELDGKITTAQGAANKAQEEVDALETTVNNLSGTVSSNDTAVRGLISDEATNRDNADKAIKAIIGTVEEGKTVVGLIGEAQTAAETKVTELSNGQVKTNKEDIATIKGDYLTSADKGTLEAADSAILGKIGTVADDKTVVGLISEAQTAAQGYADTKAGDVQTNLTNHINNTYSPKVQALVNEDARIAGLVSAEEQARKDAIGTVNSEISRVAGLVSAEETRAKGIEAGLRTDITNIQNNIASGLHFRGVVASKDEIENPVDGDICIVGNVEYIYSDGWKELGNAEAHATYEHVNTELAKKADKDIYEAKVAELAGEDKAIREAFVKADADLKSELQGNIDGKVAQGDFDTLEGRVDGHDTAIAAKLESSVYEEHITAYNDKVGELESKDTELAGKISAIETSLLTGDIHTEIGRVETLAQKGVDDAKAAQDDINELAGKVGAISGEKTLVEQLAAVKATTDAAAVKETVEAEFGRVDDELANKVSTEGYIAFTQAEKNKLAGIAEGANKYELPAEVVKDANYATRMSTVESGITTEKGRAEAAELALSNRVKVFEDKFGDAETILVFDCGSSTEVI